MFLFLHIFSFIYSILQLFSFIYDLPACILYYNERCVNVNLGESI